MTVEIDNPEAIAEIEEYMSRFNLSAKEVVERILIDVGIWMPMETLAYPKKVTAPEYSWKSSKVS